MLESLHKSLGKKGKTPKQENYEKANPNQQQTIYTINKKDKQKQTKKSNKEIKQRKHI